MRGPWQVVPEVLWSDDPAVTQFGAEALMRQSKIVIAELTP
ncbi:MAG TPA: hypothetical protein VNT53_01155 [Pseudolysinimonas sp.]|nr:hypothetical protein [Pseudolysinimonas sp.]